MTSYHMRGAAVFLLPIAVALVLVLSNLSSDKESMSMAMEENAAKLAPAPYSKPRSFVDTLPERKNQTHLTQQSALRKRRPGLRQRTHTGRGIRPTTSLSSEIHIDLGIDIVNATNYTTYPYWPEIPPEVYDDLSRSFEPWSSNYSWCEQQDNFYNEDTPGGILFVKVPKAASSTLSGIVLRIAHRHYEGNNGTCKTKQAHVYSRKYNRRDRKKSFMIGNIRDVVSRELSHFYYRLGELSGYAPASLQKELLKSLSSGPHLEWFRRGRTDLGFQLGYLSMTGMDQDSTGRSLSNNSLLAKRQSVLPSNITLPMVKSRVERVIQEYDFITVAERMDESLVALQLLLDLDTHDLLYLPSKVAGSYSLRLQQCISIQKPATSSEVKAYLQSNEWYTKNFGDYVLYKAVNASLDETIQRLGQDRFASALEKYRQLLQKAQSQCRDKALFPCSKNGTLQNNHTNCYSRDWGCGYPCLDQVE